MNSNKNTEKITKVTLNVTDTLKVKLDKVAILVNIVSDEDKLCSDSETALKEAYNDINKVIEITNKFNVNKENITIDNPYVRRKDTYVDTDKALGLSQVKHERVRQTLGYMYSSRITIKINSNNKSLTTMYSELAKLENVKNINANFYLEDKDRYSNELLSKLVKKSKEQAEVIADAANLSVKSLLSINNNSNTNNISYMNYMSESNTYTNNTRCFVNNVSNVLDINSNNEAEITATIKAVYSLG